MKPATGKGFRRIRRFKVIKAKIVIPAKCLSRADSVESAKRKKQIFFFAENKIRLILTPLLKHYKINFMNKAELIAKVADDAGVTKTQANASLDSFIEAVTKTLKGGGKVTLVGFGTFSVSKRKARKGRNPQTGEEISIKARKVARFKAGKELAAKL